jgi:hypothetical protein
LRDMGDLRRLGAHVGRSSAYLTLAGQRPPHQLPLW